MWCGGFVIHNSWSVRESASSWIVVRESVSSWIVVGESIVRESVSSES